VCGAQQNVYVSERSQIQFENENHAVYMSFRWVTTTLSSLRPTTCGALRNTQLKHDSVTGQDDVWTTWV